MSTDVVDASSVIDGDQMVARAEALRPRLIAEQRATEQRTMYAPELHETFREQGFYRMLTPRRYGASS